MSVPSIREQLVGGWRLVSYTETQDGGTDGHPLGDKPLGTILYTPDGYMSAQLAKPGPYDPGQQPDAYAIAYSGPYVVNEQAQTVDHQVQVALTPSWLGTTQTRHVHFADPDTLVLSADETPRNGMTTTIRWSRQAPR